MEFQLIIGSVVIVLIVLFVYLKRTKGHQESNLPAVSEDVNLPAKMEENLEALNPKSETNPENPKS